MSAQMPPDPFVRAEPPMVEQAAAVVRRGDAMTETLVARAKELGDLLAKLPKKHPAHDAWDRVQNAIGNVVEHRRHLAEEVLRLQALVPAPPPIDLAAPVEELGLSKRAERGVLASKAWTVKALTERRPLDLLMIRGFGPACLREVKEVLAAHGLRLAGGATYETRSLLAGAYKGRRLSQRNMHTHVVRLDDDRFSEVLCGKVDLDSVADYEAEDIAAPATCPSCAKKDPRRRAALPAGGAS